MYEIWAACKHFCQCLYFKFQFFFLFMLSRTSIDAIEKLMSIVIKDALVYLQYNDLKRYMHTDINSQISWTGWGL